MPKHTHPDPLFPFAFDDRACVPYLPKKMVRTSRESRAHISLKWRLARAAIAAGWSVAFETGPHIHDVVCIDAGQKRVVGLEAVVSPGTLDVGRCDSPVFWFLAAGVKTPIRHATVFRADASLPAVIARCLRDAPVWEAPLLSAWDLRYCFTNNPALYQVLKHPEEHLEDLRLRDRLQRSCHAAIYDRHYGRELVTELLALDDEVLASWDFTRAALEVHLLPRTYHLRMDGAGL